MNVFESIIFSVVLLLFPIFVYLFYLIVNKNIDESKKNLALKFALISSIYLLERYPLDKIFNCLVLTLPIFICFRRNFRILTLVLSVVVTICCIFSGGNYYLFFIVQMLILITLNKEKSITKYIVICVVVSITYLYCYGSSHLFNDLIYIMAFIGVVIIVKCTMFKGEEVINYHIEHKDLLKEREIRSSLFKITHEIKNPLAVCKGYIDIFDYDDPDCAKKYLPILSGEIDKMLVLLQDFLLVNKDNINRDIMDINLLMEEVTYTMKELNRFDIKLDYLEDDEIYINGDYNRLTQVLTNLIKNAYEAHAKNIVVKSYLEEDDVIVEVIDDGDGITEHVYEKIYEPFFTTKRDGTGLGVPLSKEIIEAHSGTLDYLIEQEKGTVVRIKLPLQEI